MVELEKTVAEKMGIKENTTAFFKNAVVEAIENIKLQPLDISTELNKKFDYIHLFTKSDADLNENLAELIPHLNQNGMLWVSWPKGGKLEIDLNLKIIIKIGYDHGLVESKSLSINDTWSALKFTHPIEGKVYNNSYGKLP